MSRLKKSPKFAAFLMTVLGFGLTVALLTHCGRQSSATDDDGQSADAGAVPASWSGDEDLASDHWTIEEL
jgi:hypothetical protein